MQRSNGSTIGLHYERLRYILSSNFPLILFGATTILLFADQNLLAPNLTAAAKEFGFTNVERDQKLGGDIALAFFLLGAPVSFVVACLGDLFPVRVPLFVAMVFLGEGACALTYFTTTYGQLYVCRAMTGISVGGALPLVHSILGDLYPAEKRGLVSACVSVGIGLGISLGQGVAGYLGPTHGWRSPFFVVAAPALLTAVGVAICVKEPSKGSNEGVDVGPRNSEGPLPLNDVDSNISASIMEQHDLRQSEEQNPSPLGKMDDAESIFQLRSIEIEDSMEATNNDDQYCDINQAHIFRPNNPTKTTSPWKQIKESIRVTLQSMKEILKTPTVVLLMLQGVPGCVPWGIFNTYFIDYLSEDRGNTVQGATTVVLIFGIGNFFGILVGGRYGDRLYAISPEQPSLLAGISAIVGCAPFWVLLNTESTAWTVSFPVALVAGISAGVTGPIVKATVSNVTLPRRRGQAFALMNTFDDFGKGLGPVFVADLIAKSGGVRRRAFNIGVSGWILCGLLNLCVYFTAKKDNEKMRREHVLERRGGNNETISDTSIYT